MLNIDVGGHHQLGECSSSSLRGEGGAGRGPAQSEAQPLPLPPLPPATVRLQVFRQALQGTGSSLMKFSHKNKNKIWLNFGQTISIR